MTVRTVSVAPEYLSFYMSGSADVDVPVEYGADGVFGNRECLVISCLYWNEGDTTITMDPYRELQEQGTPPEFDGILSTPDRKVILHDVNLPEILAMNVEDTATRVRIWINHPVAPDKVTIALG